MGDRLVDLSEFKANLLYRQIDRAIRKTLSQKQQTKNQTEATTKRGRRFRAVVVAQLGGC